MSSQQEEEATISIPSLAIVAVLGFFIYRYFFSSRNESTGGASSSTSRNGLRFTPAQVDQIAQVFPQLNRRDIMWDLHRNRGSVQATTERVLMSGRLEPAPPSFQPPISLTTTSTVATNNSSPSHLLKQQPDLITRYNLQSRVSSKGKEREQEEEIPAKGWSNNKDQRQQMLQRRRDEMILAARRKMQEKESQQVPLPPEAT